MTRRPAARTPAPMPVPVPVVPPPGPGVLEAFGVAAVCASAALSSVIEVLHIPTYAGTHIVPIVVPAAIAGNIIFPVLGRLLAGRTWAAALAVASWLVPILTVTVVVRPEGDVLVSGAQGQPAVFYALVLVGAAVGFGTAAVLNARGRPKRVPVSR